ncbi:hypothetical protein [Polymorphobacter megasporae]|uniref:hypothetical protein n=1 Tax=Glacieibacterium megasporae TaxID=2835787 RepID=UPI001C1DCF2E|nr:hypothetical protein [Polymorphobacter megasporae]UAJ12765.1 hypothetical protein KTC28_19660 [Polymorphobacter megasporae]
MSHAVFSHWLRRRQERAVPNDAFGQSLIDDIRFLVRFQRCRSTPVTWMPATACEKKRWDAHSVIGRFGDPYAVAVVNGEEWVVRERIWHGWPDPARFVFFAVSDERIRVAVDFNAWPQVWVAPAGPGIGIEMQALENEE